jgi:hypothetical protein
MASVSFTVRKTRKQGSWWKSFFRIFNKKLNSKAEKEIVNKLLHDMKERHRYNHLTYDLRDNTLAEGSLSSSDGLRFYVDVDVVEYGLFIVKGFKSWAPDPFIDEAIERNKEYILQILSDTLDETTIEFNRG